jgi:hypothetical protein
MLIPIEFIVNPYPALEVRASYEMRSRDVNSRSGGYRQWASALMQRLSPRGGSIG